VIQMFWGVLVAEKMVPSVTSSTKNGDLGSWLNCAMVMCVYVKPAEAVVDELWSVVETAPVS
jgi:hypothetical protein